MMTVCPTIMAVRRSKRGADIDGFVLLDKPRGLSSNHALQRVRRAYGARKAGHTGSLDPLATGLLPVCLGEATKLSSHLLSAGKTYRVTACLAYETTTGDSEGEISRRSERAPPAVESLRKLLDRFVGPQQQIPPMYSALKRCGKPLYEYARAGQAVERAARPVTVSFIHLVAFDNDSLTLDVAVSGGTYIRTLIEDIARAWGGCAHVTALRRTGVGDIGAADSMTTLQALEGATDGAVARARALQPISALLKDWPVARLDVEQTRKIRLGQPVVGSWSADDRLWRLQSWDGLLLGLGVCVISGQMRPKRLFVRPQH